MRMHSRAALPIRLWCNGRKTHAAATEAFDLQPAWPQRCGMLASALPFQAATASWSCLSHPAAHQAIFEGNGFSSLLGPGPSIL